MTTVATSIYDGGRAAWAAGGAVGEHLQTGELVGGKRGPTRQVGVVLGIERRNSLGTLKSHDRRADLAEDNAGRLLKGLGAIDDLEQDRRDGAGSDFAHDQCRRPDAVDDIIHLVRVLKW